MKLDTIELTPTINTSHGKIFCDITINGKKINHDTDLFAFLLSKNNNFIAALCDDTTQKELKELSGFFPFTCSCGNAGCVDLFNGIKSKHRKKTVEWKVPTSRAYKTILDKSFYRFSTEQYELELAKIWNWLKINDGEIISTSTYFDDETNSEETTFVTVGDIMDDRCSSYIDYIDEELTVRVAWMDSLVRKYLVN